MYPHMLYAEINKFYYIQENIEIVPITILENQSGQFIVKKDAHTNSE